MQTTDKKNISEKVTDVVRPHEREGGQRAHEYAPPASEETMRTFAPRGIRGGIRQGKVPFAKLASVFFLLSAIIIGIALYREYRASEAMLGSLAGQGEALNRFAAPRGEEMRAGETGAAPAQEKPLLDFTNINATFSVLKNAGKAYGDFQALSQSAAGFYTDALRFASDAPEALLGRDGEGLLPGVKELQASLARVLGASEAFRPHTAGSLASFIPVSRESYLGMEAEARRLKAFLDELAVWMDTDEVRHVAVFFENPAELRPGGGFLGSYADVAMKKGKIMQIDIHDVNDADRLLEETIIPPKPLQAITGRWRAADANWFFDFPASAKKSLQFLESSRLYQGPHATFDMAIGISGKVLEDTIDAVGGVTLADGTVLKKGNVMSVLQSRVQEGQETRAAYPKEVLKELSALLTEKMRSLSDDARGTLLARGEDWLAERDMRVYAKYAPFQNFFENFGATGSAFRIPERFMGDYLALASANIGGGKSDFYMKTKVTLESQILEEGKVENRLTLTRTHAAPQGSSWWYRETNRAYLQINTPPSAQLTYASGGSVRKITPKINYIKEGYTEDEDVVRVERTAKEDAQYPEVSTLRDGEKNIFATWSNVPAGASRQVSFAYTERLTAVPQEGVLYQFVFDKQSGANAEYHFEIHAPIGYVFAETNSPMYEYDSASPSGRVVIPLTFSKIKEIR